MLVYGDQESSEQLADVFARLRRRWSEVETASTPEARRAGTGELGVECGKLVQALLDRAFEARGSDERSELADAGATLCLALGRAFAHGGLAAGTRALSELERHAPAGELRLREPEGYAFYALYPDLYVAAAQALERDERPVQVIGIRSIGTSLGGFVAGALDSPRLPFTVRPVGHPFARQLRIGPRLEAALLEGAARALYVIVDEGPGLSGSSFVAVADWLLARGIRREQIRLFPSHDGAPGGAGAADVRARYARLARSFVPFERCFDHAALRRWFDDRIGPAPGTITDLGGGRWRALFYRDAARQPPSHVRDERRKYLLRRHDGTWLMKYVGLGERARGVLERARLLSQAGFTPELVAAHYGLALTRFHAEATPLPLARYERSALIAQLVRYLVFLAQHFRVGELRAGASPERLLELMKHNTGVLLGGERASALARFDALLPALLASHAATATDNKLDACEWLLLPDGSWRKCDAEAHHTGHDRIGCQDPSWDVAGATLELGLDATEREQLVRALRDQAGIALEPEKLAFFELAYAAFRAGSAHYAELALAGWADQDAARWRAEKARYTREIERRLDGV